MSRHSRLSLLPAVFMLVLGLAGCGASTSAAGKAAITPHPMVHLPADQAAHSSAHDEWWYVVGHLRDGGRTFGYEVTIFKLLHVRPPGFSSTISLYRTDIAISDIASDRFYHRITYWFPQGQTLSNRTLDLHVGSATLVGASPAAMRLRAGTPFGRIDLHLSSQKPAMDVGGTGYVPFGKAYTYYYSLTDLASVGSLTIGGRRFPVSGISWLDHQWGNWSRTGITGWTWMALQLDNGVQLSVFNVRESGGTTKLVSISLANGSTRTQHGLAIIPTGQWTSPHTGAHYPSGWIVRIPGMDATLRVAPSILDQEMTVPGQRQASSWEGAGTVSGSWLGKPIRGQSYTELTGYAR